MNLLPEMQHVEVIVVAGIAAVSVVVGVSTVVLGAVYLATRERAPKPAVARHTAPVNATPAETNTEVRSPLAAAR